MAKRKSQEPNYAGMLAGLIEARGEYERHDAECKKHAPQIVKTLRKEMGLTLRQIAERLDVNFTYVSKIENGHLQAGLPFLKSLYDLWKVHQTSKSKPDA